MDMDYDENLLENEFLQELTQQYNAILDQVIQERWIICVPRRGSFQRRNFQKNEINAHILIPRQDLSNAQFDTLDGREVLFTDRILTIKHNNEQYSSRLLFEETFYSRNLCKYCVWCIEQPLEASISILDNDVNIITNLQEAVNFLRVELLEKKLHNDLETRVKHFLHINKNLDCKPLQVQRNLVHTLYTNCLEVLLDDVTLREKILNSKYYYLNVRVSLEMYILYALRHVLLKSLSACTAVEDATLNKIMRNLSEIQLSDLQVRSDLQSCVYRGRSELSRLDCFVTVLGKLECLRRTTNCISHETTSAITSDDLLPVLIYLVIKSGLSNWTAQLIFMKQFRFSMKSHDTDEGDFLITSLEAAIEHIKSEAISRNLISDHSKEFNGTRTHNVTSEHPSNVEHLFTCIKNGDLSEVERILTYNKSKQVNPIALCHPLCTCVSCERNWMHRQDLSACPDKDLTPLHAAVLHNQTSIVIFLLDHDLDINVVDSDGLTALHYACIGGYQIILLHLLQANADPTITDPGGNTPLHLAADRGHENCVKALLYLSEQMKTTVDVDASNGNGDTALHLAAKWGYCSTVRILLECGANCKLTNRKGQTPLTATYSKYIAKLLEYDANTCSDSFYPRQSISSQTSKDSSTLHSECYANYTVQQHTMDRLLAAIIEGDTCLACYYLGLEVYRERLPDLQSDLCHPLCDCERCSVISESLLERCNRRRRALAINACNSLGETALHVASATGRTEMVRLLLDAGANVNVTTVSEGRTPLHLACLNGNVDAVKFLLNCATCDIDAKDHDGDTSLHLVTRAGNAKLVGLLLRHGASTDIRNQHNMTPLRQLEVEMSNVLPENYAGILKILKRNSSPQSTFDD